MDRNARGGSALRARSSRYPRARHYSATFPLCPRGASLPGRRRTPHRQCRRAARTRRRTRPRLRRFRPHFRRPRMRWPYAPSERESRRYKRAHHIAIHRSRTNPSRRSGHRWDRPEMALLRARNHAHPPGFHWAAHPSPHPLPAASPPALWASPSGSAHRSTHHHPLHRHLSLPARSLHRPSPKRRSRTHKEWSASPPIYGSRRRFYLHILAAIKDPGLHRILTIPCAHLDDSQVRIKLLSMIRLIVNGQERSFQSPIDVRGLLDALGLGDTLVAVERNREIVPRAEYASTPLEENDEIEIVHFVGGG